MLQDSKHPMISQMMCPSTSQDIFLNQTKHSNLSPRTLTKGIMCSRVYSLRCCDSARLSYDTGLQSNFQLFHQQKSHLLYSSPVAVSYCIGSVIFEITLNVPHKALNYEQKHSVMSNTLHLSHLAATPDPYYCTVPLSIYRLCYQ